MIQVTIELIFQYRKNGYIKFNAINENEAIKIANDQVYKTLFERKLRPYKFMAFVSDNQNIVIKHWEYKPTYRD